MTKEKIQCISLQKAFEKCQVQKVNLLKIDVEGSEIEIVEGAPSDLWHLVDRVVVEYHDTFRPGCRERVVNCLSRNGFGKITIQEASPDPRLGLIFAQK